VVKSIGVRCAMFHARDKVYTATVWKVAGQGPTKCRKRNGNLTTGGPCGYPSVKAKASSAKGGSLVPPKEKEGIDCVII